MRLFYFFLYFFTFFDEYFTIICNYFNFIFDYCKIMLYILIILYYNRATECKIKKR